ncbi:MAG TPA: hypothetical protein VJ941_10205 [Gracilimonas sp.]|nr:hypothetical protein [Gracilimonas sp.]
MKYIATGIISPFHLYSSLGAFYKLNDKLNTDTVNAVIHVMKNFNDEYLIKEFYSKSLTITANSSDIKILDLPMLFVKFCIALVFFKSRKTNFIAHHTYFNIRDLKHFTVRECLNLGIVIFEEGTGSYNTIRRAVTIARKENLKLPFLRTILKKLFSIIYHHKFFVLIKNENFEYFQKAIEFDIKNELTKDYETEKGFKEILFDDYRIEAIPAEEYNFMIKDNLAVKPHPGTDLKFYSKEVQIIDSKVSAEKILFKENVKNIYVRYSGVGLFVKNNFNDINVINVEF